MSFSQTLKIGSYVHFHLRMDEACGIIVKFDYEKDPHPHSPYYIIHTSSGKDIRVPASTLETNIADGYVTYQAVDTAH